MNHERLLADVGRVLAHWDETAVDVSPVPGGTLNWNFEVTTKSRKLFLRCYRQNLEIERIRGEHALTSWAAQRGLPAPAPLPTATGSTLVEWEGRAWAVFPWVEGLPVPRGSLNPVQAEALGDLHGRTQAILADHEASSGAAMHMRWDKAQSLALFDKVIDAARSRPTEGWLLAGLARQRDMLASLRVHPPEYFSELPCQVLHGDFHDQQVLFQGDAAVALVDWEIWHTDPRAWEVVRSLAFSRLPSTACRSCT